MSTTYPPAFWASRVKHIIDVETLPAIWPFMNRLPHCPAAPATPQNRAGATPAGNGAPSPLPWYARQQNYKSLKQSSFDRTGGNADRWPIAPGATQELFKSDGPGIITHIWFTIAAQSPTHLKEIVIRGYWDGNEKPSIEVPAGDFFGLDTFEGKPIVVRCRWARHNGNPRFEEAFSADKGKTWQTVRTTDYERVT